ncbi:MAG: hypothetical protein CEO40_315 [Parcubacteria group bacterium LiPW_72]|nr:MAG: hypothetical protein CEO40_315 [Parcubacteria group bacterium LiPW_72]
MSKERHSPLPAQALRFRRGGRGGGLYRVIFRSLPAYALFRASSFVSLRMDRSAGQGQGGGGGGLFSPQRGSAYKKFGVFQQGFLVSFPCALSQFFSSFSYFFDSGIGLFLFG